MSDKKMKWTEQQADAIKERGRDVFVTASAGTGKTAVLSGRCVDIVSDKNICPDIWNILVVTFTDAAAEQMRQRIAKRLNEAYAENKDIHLKRQLIMLAGADISTIHSFCKRLITENFYELGIDPAFGMIDGDEQKLIKSQVLEQTVEWVWDQPNLTDSLRELLSYRNLDYESGVLNSIIEISNFLEGVIDKNKWLEEAMSPNSNLTEQKQSEMARIKLDEIIRRIRQIQKVYLKQNTGNNWEVFLEEKYVEPLERIAVEKDLKKFAVELSSLKKPRAITPKGLPDTIAKLLKDSLKETIDQIDDIKALAVFNPEYIEKINTSASSQMKVLIELVRKFDDLYAETKRILNRLDFADLERLTVKLLAKKISSDREIEPSETAIALRKKYKHIFVDEYQDINQVQKTIIDLLSGDGNVFVVGDIKQSIYAFRGAEPSIFADDLKTATDKPKDGQQPRRVDLNLNFRSDKGILDFVNHIFDRLMTESMTGIDYDENASLKPGLEEVVNSDNLSTVELHLLDADKDSDLDGSCDEITARQRQAVAVTKRISEMVDKEQIYDNKIGQYRLIEYRDIVILMRSPTKRANEYVEILRMAGIPVSSETAAGYFETTEISDCLSLLKILDNPQRDIELAAVLRSPFFNVTDSELAEIRLLSKDRDINFYECVKTYAESNTDKYLTEKLQKILTDIDSWRSIATEGSIADLLWMIFRRTDILAFVSALPNGKGRKANLLKLHDRAIQFENFAISGGSSSLCKFVWFIEKLQAEGTEWSSAEPEGTSQNAIRIMSIHKSKGLEFPVVFLCETESKFNLKDTTKDILLSNDLPIGLRVIDANLKIKLSTAAHQLLVDERLKKNLAEEMRILYVTLTRAKQKLILTGSIKKKSLEQMLIKGFCFSDKDISQKNLAKCRSFVEWLIYGLSDAKNLHEEIKTGFESETSDCDLFDLKYYSGNDLTVLSDYIQKIRKLHKKPTKTSTKPKAQMELLKKVKEALSWEYDYQIQTNLPAKQSITQLTHFSDEFINIDYSKSMQRQPAVVMEEEGYETDVQSKMIGTATHLVISKINLSKLVDANSVSMVIEELIAEGSINKQTADRINIESIVTFFQSDIGKMALEKPNKVSKEWPFTYALPINDSTIRVTSDESRETVVVQGIIDMLIETSDRIVIIDFKTDRISANQAEERAQKYALQLNYYAQAAEAIINKPILAKWLYFVTPALSVKI